MPTESERPEPRPAATGSDRTDSDRTDSAPVTPAAPETPEPDPDYDRYEQL